MTHSKNRAVWTLPTRLLVSLLLAAGLAACGSDNTVTPPPPSPTPAPASARLGVTQEGVGNLGFSPLAQFTFRVRAEFRIQETGGSYADLNYIRLSFFRGSQEVERREVGASDLTAALGTNRIPANSNSVYTLRFDFNSSDFDRIALVFNFTDQRSEGHEVTLPDIQVVPVFGIITGAATPDGFGGEVH